MSFCDIFGGGVNVKYVSVYASLGQKMEETLLCLDVRVCIFMSVWVYLLNLSVACRRGHKVNLFTGVELISFQSFPSSKSVTIARINNPVSPIIYTLLREGWKEGFMPFSRALVQKSNTNWHRIWTRAATSIF